MREQSGITSFADLAQLLQNAPKQLLDSLRQSAVVRQSAVLLGATLGDRLRINAKWALRGMGAQHDDPGGGRRLQFVGALQSRLTRWRLAAHVALLRAAYWISSVVHSWTAMLVAD